MYILEEMSLVYRISNKTTYHRTHESGPVTKFPERLSREMRSGNVVRVKGKKRGWYNGEDIDFIYDVTLVDDVRVPMGSDVGSIIVRCPLRRSRPHYWKQRLCRVQNSLPSVKKKIFAECPRSSTRQRFNFFFWNFFAECPISSTRQSFFLFEKYFAECP